MAEVTRDEIRRQYEIAIEEYRFNVQLNWDRTKYYLLLNGAVVAAATGLHGLALGTTGTLLLAALFAFGVTLAVLGVISMTKGHRYYRMACVKKTELEAALGFLDPMPGRTAPHGNLAVTTTEGMQETAVMLKDPIAWIARPLRKGTITFVLRIAFVGVAIVHALGLGLAVSRLL